MTERPDFEQMTRAWLDLMPSEAPDRTVAAVLQVIERTPQLRPPLFAPRRFQPMNRVTLAAMAAALAAVLVGGAYVLSQFRLPNVGPSPTTVLPSPVPVNTPGADLPGGYAGQFDSSGTVGQGIAFGWLIALADGSVLGIGDDGGPAAQASIWDPTTRTVSVVGRLTTARENPAMVLLDDGRVLIVGGEVRPATVNGNVVGVPAASTAELFDPATRSFTVLPPLAAAGWGQTLTRLQDGRVLVLDGWAVGPVGAPRSLATAEIFDPVTDTFAPTGSLSGGFGGDIVAVLTAALDDGRVLAVDSGGTGAAELFDPGSGTFTRVAKVPAAPPTPAVGRFWPTRTGPIVPLGGGRALVAGRNCEEGFTRFAGGQSEGWYPTDAYAFEGATGTFEAIAAMPHCIETATPLRDGLVLLTSFAVVDGRDWDWSAIYDPATGQFFETEPPPGGQYIERAALPDGTVLFTGVRGGTGQEPAGVLEVYR
jgi:hypothetical protein